MRLALKLATGAGKTTVMAMLIAWQTINAVRRPGSKHFTRGFLVVTPGLTIKDRLRVLQPNDPDSYYASRELVPERHARRRATAPRSSSPTTTPSSCASASSCPRAAARCSRARGEELNTLETEGQMLQRVMPDLMGMKNILVLNDEAHHCYREKPSEDDDEDLKGDERKEAEKNNEAARLWISGLEAVNRKLGVAPRHRPVGHAVLPARLRLCRGHAVPVDDERLLADGRHRVRHRQAAARARWPTTSPATRCRCSATCGRTSARTCRRRGAARPRRSTRSSLPPQLQTALEALYGHYEKTFELWAGRRHHACRPASSSSAKNTAISKLVYDYISGFHRKNDDGTTTLENGRLALFRNFDETRQPAAAPEHAADRQRAARSRRGARRQLPRHGRRRDRALPPRDRRAHRRPPRRPRTSPTRNCCARS